jgi:hypothetical protein
MMYAGLRGRVGWTILLVLVAAEVVGRVAGSGAALAAAALVGIFVWFAFPLLRDRPGNADERDRSGPLDR